MTVAQNKKDYTNPCRSFAPAFFAFWNINPAVQNPLHCRMFLSRGVICAKCKTAIPLEWHSSDPPIKPVCTPPPPPLPAYFSQAKPNRQPLECHLDLLAYNGRKVHYFEYNRRNRRFSDRLLFLPIWGTFFCCGQHCGQKMSAKTHMSGPKSGKITGFWPFSAKTGSKRYFFRSAQNMRT